MKRSQNILFFYGVDSPFFSTITLFKTSCFPRVFGGFPDSEGSLERMEMEAIPRVAYL